MYPGKWAEISPDKAAAIHSKSGEVISFRELDDRSNQLARTLWERGLRRGDHIAILCKNDLIYFEIAWAALRSGLYLTTINRYLSSQEAGYILADSTSKALIATAELEEVACELPSHAPNCQTFLAVGGDIPGFDAYADAVHAQPATPLDEEPLGSFMLYSSGTTGKPKGICHPLTDASVADHNDHHAFHQETWSFDENTVYLSPAPIYHAAPAVLSISTQALGGTVVMMPGFEPKDALEAIEKYSVTHSQWVPTMFTRFVKMPEADRAGYDLSSHRVAIHAAAPCPVEIKKEMLDWWGPIIYEYYSGTEAVGSTHVTPQEWLKHPGTVGQSMGGAIHICDEDGTELESGQTGLIYFEMAREFGYHKDEEKTRSSRHPFRSDWAGLGDVGYLNDEGFLFLTDRATFMIISGGVNIYPQEIENVLILHPKVADVAVIGVPNTDMGEEVKAIVQAKEGLAQGPELASELIGYVRSKIAHFKCPKTIDFRSELPRLPTGKLYKQILKDEYWNTSEKVDNHQG